MGLNDIDFPATLLADLYQNALIPDENINEHLIREAQGKVRETAPEKRAFLGENKKQILVIVKDVNHTWTSDEELQFLSDILKACQLSMADIALLNVGARKESFAELQKEFPTRQAILFGVSQEELGIPLRFPEFQVQAYTDKQVLAAPPLLTIANDKILKSKLWVSLRKLFNI